MQRKSHFVNVLSLRKKHTQKEKYSLPAPPIVVQVVPRNISFLFFLAFCVCFGVQIEKKRIVKIPDFGPLLDPLRIE